MSQKVKRPSRNFSPVVSGLEGKFLLSGPNPGDPTMNPAGPNPGGPPEYQPPTPPGTPTTASPFAVD